MSRILCSTGALIGRPNGRDYRLLSEYAKKLNCDGFEFMIYESWYNELDMLVDTLSSFGLDFVTFHCEKGIGEYLTRGEFSEAERRFTINCEVAKALGAKLLVLHLWNGPLSDSCTENNFSVIPAYIDLAAKYGLVFTIENVVCKNKSPMHHLDKLIDVSELNFTFDTKMAAFHDELGDIFASERSRFWSDKRISHLHINDYGGGYMEWGKLSTLHLGDGHIDFEAFFEKLSLSGYQGDFTVEATAFDSDGKVNLEKLNKDFEKIRSLTAKYNGF